MYYPNQTDSDRKEILRILSLYHQLELSQLIRLFPAIPEPVLLSLLKRMGKQGRLSLCGTSVQYLPETAPVEGMKEAFEVLLDFLPEVTYHSPGDYPVTLTFFAREESYDVIYLPPEKELLTAHALSLKPHSENSAQRLVVLSSKEQMEKISGLPDVTAFCLVSGQAVQYFKKQQGGTHG